MAEHNGNGSLERFIDINKIFAIVAKNWLVLKRDQVRLIPLTMFPLIMIIIYGFSIGASPKGIYAGIVDYDNSELSHQVALELYSTEMFSIKSQFGGQDEGKRHIDSGDIKVLFIIPPGFGDDIQSGRTASLSVIVDESEPTIAQMLKSSTQVFVQSLAQELTVSKLKSISAKSAEASASLSKATVLLNQGAKLSEVQDILGHASPETTKKIYAHYEVGHLRAAFDQYSLSAEEMAERLKSSRQRSARD